MKWHIGYKLRCTKDLKSSDAKAWESKLSLKRFCLGAKNTFRIHWSLAQSLDNSVLQGDTKSFGHQFQRVMIARREAPRNKNIDSSTKDIHG